LNVYTLVAWGGVGKTSLVAHWVSERMAARAWPGVERYFDWSFYSQGTGESRQTSSDLFIQEALKFFDDPDPTQGSPWERGERLARLVRRHRTLLVLDGIEPLQYPLNDPQAGRLKDQALEALLQGLAADNSGLCVVTTREHLTNLENQATTEEQKLDTLDKDAAIDLLRHLQIAGTEAEMEAAWRDAGGHALTLQLLGRFLADAHGGDIRHYKEVKFEEAEPERRGRSAFKVMIAYERWLQSAGPERERELALLRLTGLFDRPIARDCLQALRAEPAIPGLTDTLVKLKDAQWNIALKRLGEVDLLTMTPDAIDAHPLIREYFAEQLRDTQPEAFRAAHSRLFDHLCASTPHRPDTLAGLQPLYQAVTHGCLAGRHQEACDEVYFDRILRGGTGADGFYSWRMLGAIGADLGAVAAFYEEPWRRLAPDLSAPDQAWLLAVAAFHLRALGRLTEAVEPMRVAVKMAEDAEKWMPAAARAGNLSELEVTLGRLDEAVGDGRRAIVFADRSGDDVEKADERTIVADALHQAGERAEAGALFAEAERMQALRQPKLPRLYSVQGSRYAGWLLAPAERAAWSCVLAPSGDAGRSALATPPGVETPYATALDACAEAGVRATQTLEWDMTHAGGLLDFALDHLTLARAALYRALVGPPADPAPAATPLGPRVTTALTKLRQANQVYYLPMALLTASLYHGTLGADPGEARRLLAEAQQIAERGPMPLYLADVHLHRARLFHDRAALAEARALIERHGYGRRRDELADAEAAAAHW
jgi:tetratricopeptide (TPR) repeat protein